MKGLDKASIDAITINKLEDGRQMFMPCYIGEDAEKPGRGTPADGLRSKATVRIFWKNVTAAARQAVDELPEGERAGWREFLDTFFTAD